MRDFMQYIIDTARISLLDGKMPNIQQLFESALFVFFSDGKHRGDPCIFCGTPHDEVEIGDCPGTRRNPTT
jgi:hypothetical protein